MENTNNTGYDLWIETCCKSYQIHTCGLWWEEEGAGAGG